MKRASLIQICLILGFAAPAALARGTVGGGGGKSVVCRNPDKSIKSVELLDLWEARTLRNEIAKPSLGSLTADVDAALKNLANSFPASLDRWDNYGQDKICSDQDCLLLMLRNAASQFLEPNKGVSRLHNVKLVKTDDALELAKPGERGCKIEQTVNYQPSGGPILVNEDLYEKMDGINKAALIVHEAYYEVLRDLENELNSIRVRRAVAYVFSGGIFELVPFPDVQPGEIVCQSTSPYNYLVVSQDFMHIQVPTLEGKTVIGSSSRLENDSPNALKMVVMSDVDCSQQPDTPTDNLTLMGGLVWGSMGGPVEYDRSIKIQSICSQGKSMLMLAVRAPGETQYTGNKLTCAPAGKK